MARFSESRFCVASTAFFVAVSLCLAFAPAAYKHAPDCETCEAFRLRNVELERKLRECAAVNDLCLRDQPVPSGEHLLVGSNQYPLTGATILPCARMHSGPLGSTHGQARSTTSRLPTYRRGSALCR